MKKNWKIVEVEKKILFKKTNIWGTLASDPFQHIVFETFTVDIL